MTVGQLRDAIASVADETPLEAALGYAAADAIVDWLPRSEPCVELSEADQRLSAVAGAARAWGEVRSAPAPAFVWTLANGGYYPSIYALFLLASYHSVRLGRDLRDAPTQAHQVELCFGRPDLLEPLRSEFVRYTGVLDRCGGCAGGAVPDWWHEWFRL